ncbi:MAG TPA: SCO family protein [Myxococcales bacterium]|nr:SCO family protein [Myxococcales bacterium]
MAVAGGRWGAEYFPNVPLTTQDGKVLRFYDDLLKGKSVVINLIYTRCTASCPLETAKLAQVQRLLGDRVGKDVFFYSISIDPAHDTPEALKAYAQRFHAAPGWLFLTGKDEDVRLVSKKLGLSSPTDAATRDGHQPALMVGNEASGEWMRNSAVENPKFLAAMMSDFFGWRNGKPVRTYAAPVAIPQAGKGEYLFNTRCAACHTIGKGDGLGPDLLQVTAVRERAWLSRYIAKPDEMLAEGDPLAVELFGRYATGHMPNLGLKTEEVEAIVSYLDQKRRAVLEQARKR